MVLPPDHPFIIIYRWIFHEIINHPAIGVPFMETAISVPKKMA